MIVDIQTILAIVFVLALSVVLVVKRKHIQVQFVLGPLLYFAMMRTKLGLRFMDRMAKNLRTPLRWAGYVGIVVGFVGMAFIAYELVFNTVKLLTQASSVPGVGLVLPIQAKGVFFVPFVYWILSIFVIAVIHEVSHGILARVHDIPVKSSGFAMLGVVLPVVPAAFVEPDEQVMPTRPRLHQLSVFAAGPFSNIVTGLLFLLVLSQVFTPALSAAYVLDGVTVASVQDGGAAARAGIGAGEVITRVGGSEVMSAQSLTAVLDGLSPGQTVRVVTDVREHDVVLGDVDGGARLGITVEQHRVVNEGFALGAVGAAVLSWFAGLFYWLFLLSMGIGLFNLVPVGPIDGGRMFRTAMDVLFKKHATRVWGAVSFLFLGLILFNVFAGFVL